MDNLNITDKLILELEDQTQGIMNGLQEMPYEEIEDFVSKRQKIVDELIRFAIAESPSSIQRKRIQDILEHDVEITAWMNALRLEAQDWLRLRNQAKVQRNAYDGYSGGMESFLVDRRN